MRKDANLKGTGSNPSSSAQQDISIKGLYTFPNQFSEIPEGALSIADNCVLDAPGIIESRRGITQYGTYSTAGPVTVPIETLSMFEYNSTLVTHGSNGKVALDNGSGSFVAKNGTYNVPYPTNVESRVRFAAINQNMYFTTNSGVQKLDSVSNQPTLAGAPPALGGSAVTNGTAGWMPNNVNVAYRVIWLYTDANNNLVRGAPSDLIFASNTSGSVQNVNVTFTVPVDIVTSSFTWTYQVYRGNQSASLTTVPDDLMQQVYQGTPTSGQLTSRQVTITDSTPDGSRGATLYTTAEGITQSNYRPPFSTDIALYRGYTFYCDCKFPQTFFLTLISGSNMVNGDRISFLLSGGGGFTLTAGAAENIATGTFFNQTASTPSVNIQTTAQSIVRVLNLFANNTFLDGYYTSGFSDSPGAMRFQARTVNTNAFSINCSNTGLLFNPTLPASGSTSANTSSNQAVPNQLYYSKLQSPEAVPIVNYLVVGSSSSPIVRILALQESLFVMKQDGLYKVTGTTATSFTVTPIDVQQRPASINSAVVLNNNVYMFGDQGIIVLNDSGGVAIETTPIQEDLLRLNTPNYPGFKGATYGIAYPPDHKYILCTVSQQTDIDSSIAYVYNYITDAWTVWNTSFSAGYMRPTDDKLYFGTSAVAGSQIYQERKSYTLEDYADTQFSVTLGTRVQLASGVFVVNVSPSDIGKYGINQTIRQVVGLTDLQSTIIAVDVTAYQITIEDQTDLFGSGNAVIYNPIITTVQLAPCHGGSPNAVKQFTELSLITDTQSFNQIRVAFASDLTVSTDIPGTLSNLNTGDGWGQFAWGSQPWGSGASSLLRVRTFVPREAQKGDWIATTLTAPRAFSRMRISGVSLLFRPIGPRIR